MDRRRTIWRNIRQATAWGGLLLGSLWAAAAATGDEALARIVAGVLPLLLVLLGVSLLWSHLLRRKVAIRTRELTLNNAFLKAQSEASVDGILTVDAQGRILSWNRRFAEIHRIPPGPLEQQDTEKVLQLLAGQMADPQRFLNRAYTLFKDPCVTDREEIAFKDGQFIDRYTAPVFGPDKQCLGRVWFFRDITAHKRNTQALKTADVESRLMLAETEKARRVLLSLVEDQKAAENRLRDSEERFRSLYNSMSEGVALHRMIYGQDGKAVDYVIESVNPAFERILDLKAEDVIGHKATEVYGTAQAPHLDVFADVVSKGNPAQFENTYEPQNKTFHISATSPGPGFFATVFEDITENRRITAQLEQVQRMESIGRLAGGIAHDFNNMLSVILGNTELVMDRLEPGHPLYNDLSEIKGAADRAAALTQQLLAFARKQAAAPKVIDLNTTLDGLIAMLRRILGEDIDLAWQPASEIWSVRVDPSQVDQILVNLCINARDAISGVGRLTIETCNTTLTHGYCQTHSDTEPGDYVLLSVSDNGCGMSSVVRSHLFEPFFTTKERFDGTGLGLATVYGIIKQNNGFITVYSEQGRGTTFKIGLPRFEGTQERPQTAALENNSACALRGEETVLLVEDEPAILAMVKLMLEKLGYRVLPAATPKEALHIAKQHTGVFELVLSDIIMPEMNGQEMAKRIVADQPNIKCLFMSGYTANAIVHQGILDAGVHFIGKPFTLNALSAALRNALSEGV